MTSNHLWGGPPLALLKGAALSPDKGWTNAELATYTFTEFKRFFGRFSMVFAIRCLALAVVFGFGVHAYAEHSMPQHENFLSETPFVEDGIKVFVQPEYAADGDREFDDYIINYELAWGFSDRWEIFLEGASRLGENTNGLGNLKTGLKYSFILLEDQPLAWTIGADVTWPRFSDEAGLDGYAFNQFMSVYIPSGPRYGFFLSGAFAIISEENQDTDYSGDLGAGVTYMYKKWTFGGEAQYLIEEGDNTFRAGPTVVYRMSEHFEAGLGYFLGTTINHNIRLNLHYQF